MAETAYEVGKLADLMTELRRLESSAVNQEVLGVVKQVAEDGSVANLVEHKLQGAGAPPSQLEVLPLKGTTQTEQRAEMRKPLLAGNAPVAYTVIAVKEAGEEQKDLDVLFYRADGGAWAKKLAEAATGLGGFAGKIPWAKGMKSKLNFAGLTKGLLASFGNPTGGPDVVAAVTDADIDTDGPGGSKAKDPSWSENTSLRFPSGTSCDSRKFRGLVTPPALREEYGIAIGDLAWVSLGGKEFGAQVYDSGPSEKIGEISFRLAVDLGIYPDDSEATEARAARKGNPVKDLVTVFFPGSGGNTAMSAEAIQEGAQRCVAQWLGTMPATEKAVFTEAAGSWDAFFASLRLPAAFNAKEVLAKTEISPNTPPPKVLWHNIVPTLTVLAEVRAHFGKPLIFHSTYRSKAYNAGVGGVARSQHMAFRAVDFHVEGENPETVANFTRTLRGKTFQTALPGLTLSNAVEGLANPPPLDVTALQLRPGAGGGTDLVFHGGVQDYPTFVHVDCRGEDSSWG